MKVLATLTTAAIILSAVVGVAMAPNQDSLQAERIFAAIDRLVEQRAAAPAELEQLVKDEESGKIPYIGIEDTLPPLPPTQTSCPGVTVTALRSAVVPAETVAHWLPSQKQTAKSRGC